MSDSNYLNDPKIGPEHDDASHIREVEASAFVGEPGPVPQDRKLSPKEAALRKRCTGTSDAGLSTIRLNYLLEAVALAPWFKQEDVPKIRNNIVAMIEELAPRDPFEVQLVHHMIMTHFSAMACHREAWRGSEALDVRVDYLSLGARLTDVHAKLVAEIDKHRGKGQQKVTVKHIHVHKGGKAIVGDVDLAPAPSDPPGSAKPEPAKVEQEVLPPDPFAHLKPMRAARVFSETTKEASNDA